MKELWCSSVKVSLRALFWMSGHQKLQITWRPAVGTKVAVVFLRKCGGRKELISQTDEVARCFLFWLKSEESQCRPPTSFWRKAMQSERKLTLIFYFLSSISVANGNDASIQRYGDIAVRDVFQHQLDYSWFDHCRLQQDMKKNFLSFLKSKISQNNTYC